jgi:hypothetical protein
MHNFAWITEEAAEIHEAREAIQRKPRFVLATEKRTASDATHNWELFFFNSATIKPFIFSFSEKNLLLLGMNKEPPAPAQREKRTWD